jgi:transcriptional regulator with XRE-family HTH domain
LAKSSPESVGYSGQFAASLRRLRGLRDMSQRELARRANISPDTVSQLERGAAQPTLDTLLRLQTALGLPSLELLLAGQLAFASAQIGANIVPRDPGQPS